VLVHPKQPQGSHLMGPCESKWRPGRRPGEGRFSGAQAAAGLDAALQGDRLEGRPPSNTGMTAAGNDRRRVAA